MNDSNHNPLISDQPGDTLHKVACVLKTLTYHSDDEDMPGDDVQFGRYLVGEVCIGALEYESDRVERRGGKK